MTQPHRSPSLPRRAWIRSHRRPGLAERLPTPAKPCVRSRAPPAPRSTGPGPMTGPTSSRESAPSTLPIAGHRGPGRADGIDEFGRVAAARASSVWCCSPVAASRSPSIAEERLRDAGLPTAVLRSNWFAQNFTEVSWRISSFDGVLAVPVGDVSSRSPTSTTSPRPRSPADAAHVHPTTPSSSAERGR